MMQDRCGNDKRGSGHTGTAIPYIHTCCLSTLSLNLSKSVSCCLLAFFEMRLAQAVCSHFVLMSAAVYALRTCFSRAECEIEILKSVRDSLEKLMACRLTFVHGPSTRACKERMADFLGSPTPHSNYPPLVHHIYDDAQFALVRPFIDERHAPNLHESLINLHKTS